jgi:hypothetical protein
MSVAVALDALEAQVDEFGRHPYLITVNAAGRAHVVSVRARLDSGTVFASAGRTSRENVDSNPTVTVLWPAAPGDPYSLIVDGEGTVDSDAEEIAVTPTRAVLHRVADASADLPSCVPLEQS